MFCGVLVSLILILSGWWLWSAVLLSILLAIKFFTRLSVIHQFAQPCSLEIRMKPRPLICYHQQGKSCFNPEQVTVRISRWIVILKMSSSKQRIERILLVDNFQDEKQYSRFRRQILEMLDVS